MKSRTSSLVAIVCLALPDGLLLRGASGRCQACEA